MMISSPSRDRGDRAAVDGLGRDVAGHEAVGGAAEAPVGEQRDVLAQAGAVDRGGDREHLAHAGAAGGALVADDDDVAVAGCRRSRTAAIAASSPSNTRAGPRWWRRSWPASFTTQPSGARLPRRMARPPVALIGSASGRTTSWPGVSCGLARRARRPCLPVDGDRVLVQQAGLLQALGARAGTPPAAYRSVADEAPAGLEVAGQRRAPERCGRSRRCRGRCPASRATASRCSTALVEPPLVATAAIAFSSESLA